MVCVVALSASLHHRNVRTFVSMELSYWINLTVKELWTLGKVPYLGLMYNFYRCICRINRMLCICGFESLPESGGQCHVVQRQWNVTQICTTNRNIDSLKAFFFFLNDQSFIEYKLLLQSATFIQHNLKLLVKAYIQYLSRLCGTKYFGKPLKQQFTHFWLQLQSFPVVQHLRLKEKKCSRNIYLILMNAKFKEKTSCVKQWVFYLLSGLNMFNMKGKIKTNTTFHSLGTLQEGQCKWGCH